MTGRLMLWYATALGALGVLPFLGVRLTDAGLTDAQATATLVLLPLGTLVGGPAWAWAVDRSQRALGALRLALVGGALAFVLLAWAPHPALTVGAVALFAAFRGPVMPLADALTVAHVGRGYGRIRAFGSAGYVGMVLATGLVRDLQPLLPLLIGAGLLLLAAGMTVGLPPIPTVAPPDRADLRALFARPGVRALLAVTFLNGLSLSTYDHLFTMHVERLGLPSHVSGAAVGLGVLVEVGVLFAGRALLDRVGSGWLILIACACGVPRFAITASTESTWVLVLVQGLHGVQFGAFWIGVVDRMSELAPLNLRRSAQSLLHATGFGLATICGLGLGSLWLREGDPSALFGALVVPAIFATAGAALTLRRGPSPSTG